MRLIANVFAGLAMVLALAVTGHGAAPMREPLPPPLLLAPQSSAFFQCGPTTLAAVLAFHGIPVREQVITDAIYSPTARGVLLTDMAWFARGQGFATAVLTGTLDDLQRAVFTGQPPIVLLDLGLAGLRKPHFTAILGWCDRGVRLQD
ncbi:MAG: hypothetical protein ACO3OV_09445, partial [Steroidobacteraceae bacterium]